MALWSLGSVADEIQTLTDVPTSISGTPLLRIIDRRRIYMEQYLGQSVGSVSIEEKYQGPLINLSMGKILQQANPYGMNKRIKIDVLEIDKSSSGKTDTISSYEIEGMEELRELKGSANYYQAWG